MLESIQKREEIAAAQELLGRKLKAYHHQTINAVVGYPGGNYESDVYWLDDIGFWCCFQTIRGSRYWNAFGVSQPKPNANISITCEINFPLNGIDKRIGAVFAKDASGSIVITHRGKIGGGKKGVGKSLFLNSYRGEWETLLEDGQETTVALIASLSSPRLGNQIQAFISEVERIKISVGQVQFHPKADSDLQALFSEEFAGKKKYNVNPSVEAKCDHGLIVNALAELISKNGLVYGNDRNRDLFVLDSDRNIQSLFEIKTDISSQSLYSAIGQLLLNSVGLKSHPKLFLVLPERPNAKIVERLLALGIEVITYNLNGGNLIMPSIENFT